MGGDQRQKGNNTVIIDSTNGKENYELDEMLAAIDQKILTWDRSDPEAFSLSFNDEAYNAMIEGMDSVFELFIDAGFWNEDIDDAEKWAILSNYIRGVLYTLMENSGPANVIQAWFEINMAFNARYYN